MNSDLGLKQAISHLEAGENGLALDGLVTTWAKFKTARLSKIIRELGPRVLDDAAREAEDYASFVAAHASLESSSAATRSLGYWHAMRRSDKLQSLLGALVDNPVADPRTTNLFLFLHANPPSRNAPFWRVAVALIRHHVDPAGTVRLQEAANSDHLPGTTQRALQGRILRALARTEPGPEPTDDQAELLGRIETLLGVGVAESAVLEGLFERPLDPGRLSIWADHLSEAGDPRGEFVQLQLRHALEPLGRTAKRRMQALEKRHRDEWLSCFGPSIHLRGCRFQRGVAHRIAATTDHLEPCDELAAVSEILLTQDSERPLETPLLSPDWVGGLRTWTAFRLAVSLGATSIVFSGRPHDERPDLQHAQLNLLDVHGTELARQLRGTYGNSTSHLILRLEPWENREEARAEIREWPSAEIAYP